MTASSTIIDGQTPQEQQVGGISSFQIDHELRQYALKWASIFLALWLALFFFSKYIIPVPQMVKKPFDRMICRHRVISGLHGAIAVAVSAYYTFTSLDLSCGKQNTYKETIIIANTFGFLFADLIYMIALGFLDAGNCVHHLLGVVSYTYAFYTQKDLGYLAFHLFPGEITNVQMNLRELLRKVGMRYTKAYFHVEFNYMIMYIGARMFWIPSIYYFIFTCPESGIVISVMYPIHCVQSMYYCTCMMSLLRQRIGEINKLSKLGMKLQWFVGLSEAELEKVGIKHFNNFQG
eukprot:403340143